MMYYYHSYYYYYILLPILLYIRKSVHQKCMIILWYYIQNWQLLERVVQVKMVKNFVFLCFFLRKKDELLFFDDCMSFFWVYFWFLDKKVLLMTDFYHYCAEKIFCLQVIRRLFVRQIEKKNTYYLLILVNMNSCLSLWFKLTTEKNVCLNENKTKIKNNNAYIKEHFEMSIEKKAKIYTHHADY